MEKTAEKCARLRLYCEQQGNSLDYETISKNLENRSGVDLMSMSTGSAEMNQKASISRGVGAHGFIVPRQDRYQGEYVAVCDERLAWLTGFTGSAGYAVVLPKSAALFRDGRYTVQAAQQVDKTLFSLHSSGDDSIV